MRYNLLCKALMDAYPSLFTDEEDVLEHLFFVNGNGFEWKNGELVERYEEPTPAQMLRKARRDDRATYKNQIASYKRCGLDTAHLRRELYDRLHKSPAVLRKQEVARRFEMVEQGWSGDSGWRIENGTLVRPIYPLCEYAKILHVPADVKPDWLAAARKAYEMARSPHWCSRKGDAKANRMYLRYARDLLGTF
jgi:hypothetical protein